MQVSRILFLLCVMQLSAFAEDTCGLDKYDPKTQICCGGNVIDKDDPTEACCHITVYDPKKEICCGSTVYNKDKCKCDSGTAIVISDDYHADTEC